MKLRVLCNAIRRTTGRAVDGACLMTDDVQCHVGWRKLRIILVNPGRGGTDISASLRPVADRLTAAKVSYIIYTNQEPASLFAEVSPTLLISDSFGVCGNLTIIFIQIPNTYFNSIFLPHTMLTRVRVLMWRYPRAPGLYHPLSLCPC